MNLPKDKVNVKKTEGEEANISSIDLSEVTNDALQLRALLLKETELLKAMKVKEVGELHGEKLRLIRKLEISKELVNRDPSVLDGKTEDNIKAFREISEDIDSVIKENFDEVLKAKEVNQRVVEAIFHTVVDNESTSLGYGKEGVKSGSSSGKRVAPSIAVNESV